MRPRPFFQSLPVFTCFDRGLRFFVSKLCPNSMDARLKLPPQSSSYIYSIAAASYPTALGTGSSPASMSSSVPSRSPLTALMRGSASIWSRVHHVQSCPSTSNSRWSRRWDSVQMLDYYGMAAYGKRGQAGQSLQNYLTE